MPAFLENFLCSDYYLTAGLEGIAEFLESFVQLETDKEVAAVIGLARKCFLEDELLAALRHLEYAQRLSPSHSLITVLIGDFRHAIHRADASEPLDLIAKRTDWSGAWIRLAQVRLTFDNSAQAASDLHETLSRNATPKMAAFWPLAMRVATTSGASGWCGLDNDGRLTIGGEAAKCARSQLSFEIDGEIIKVSDFDEDRSLGLRIVAFGPEWKKEGEIAVKSRGMPLIGSPINVQQIQRVEGFLSSDAGALRGWCWFPGDPSISPDIVIRSRRDPLQKVEVATRYVEDVRDLKTLSLRKRFSLPLDEVVRLGGSVDAIAPNGRALYGSPTNPLGLLESNRWGTLRIARRFPVLGEPAAPDGDEAVEISLYIDKQGFMKSEFEPYVERPVVIAIPVYRGLKSTLDCIASVIACQTDNEEIFVVVDNSPEPLLVEKLRILADQKKITLSVQTVNRGFPATANIGMRYAAERGAHVILLNSDTLVTPGWRQLLSAAADSAPDIGTTTPLSNAATIFSYPDVERINMVPDLEESTEFAELARRANGSATVDVPTGHGFCLYIKYECMVETGTLREDVFAQGYGEENDFCMRAWHLGWRHVAVPGAYVGHLEGQSFSTAKDHLVNRNLRILNRLHPGYEQLIFDWQKRKPLAAYRRAIDIERWFEEQGNLSSTLLVTHDRAGGVLKHVNAKAFRAEQCGLRAIILKPEKTPAGTVDCLIQGLLPEAFPNLRFNLEDDKLVLEAFLRRCKISNIEIHHFIGHSPEAFPLILSLGVPYDVHIHDYSWFCPRITLTSSSNRYCGEPNLAACNVCVRDNGENIGEKITPLALRERSTRLLQHASSVIVSSEDVGRRISDRFAVSPRIEPWETTRYPLHLKRVQPIEHNAIRRICLCGAIGYEKGYEILLDCARLVSKNRLPIEFNIVGFTCDDQRLLETGCVQISGRYDEREAVNLIKQQNADFAFLPALWPETWSYVLTQFWDANLSVVAFDLGAPAERIKANKGGVVLPVGMPAKNIVEVFSNLRSEALA
jgi:GT2 family glycosyltransferase